MIKIIIGKNVKEAQTSEYTPEYLKAGHGIPELTKMEFAGMEELEEEHCSCGCEQCMSGNHTHEDDLQLDESLLYEKKDRCYYLAKQKYDVFPSAYASGYIVRCRKGKVGRKKKIKFRKKKANEELELNEKEWTDKRKEEINCNDPQGFSEKAHCQGRKKHEHFELNIEELLEEGTFDKEKSQGLHGWFARKGGKGKSKGWVDCNTCRTNPKTGRKTCKTCGRQDGEQRSKYPACRPTPSACNRRGTSKKRGPMRVSWKKKKKQKEE
jgi:hypothetical protein